MVEDLVIKGSFLVNLKFLKCKNYLNSSEEIYGTDKFFYELMGLSVETLSKAIENLKDNESSDFYSPYVLQSECDLGMLFAYPFEEVMFRQINSLREFVKYSKLSKDVLKGVVKNFPLIKGDIEAASGLYLSRIFVFNASRGLGLGRVLMENLEKIAFDAGKNSIALHVFHENDLALSLYKSMGFKLLDDEKKYFSMIKRF